MVGVGKVFGLTAVCVEINMVDLDFDEMLARVFSWWPLLIGSPDQKSDFCVFIADFEKIYNSQIAPLAEASGSKLLIQLDWIVYGTVCAALKRSSVVRLNELRVDYLEGRFNTLLVTAGVRQLSGDEESDGSFDMDELAKYLRRKNLIQISK